MESMDYYAVTAQVLPTLLIGLVLGLRGLSLNRSGWAYWLVAMMVLTLAATGACVWVIRHGHSTDALDRLIQFAITVNIAGFAALIARWFLHPDDVHSGRAFIDPRLRHKLFEQDQAGHQLPPPPPPPPRRRERFAVIVLAAVIGLLVGSRRRD